MVELIINICKRRVSSLCVSLYKYSDIITETIPTNGALSRIKKYNALS